MGALAKLVALGTFLAVAGLGYARCGERPSFLPLRQMALGAEIESARTVVYFLHGHGGSIDDVDWLYAELRREGLAPDTAVVFIDGPYSSGLGRSWGDTSEEEHISVERVRAVMAKDIADGLKGQIVVAGFSQGANIAASVAGLDNHVNVLAAFSPCRIRHTRELVARTDLRTLLVHGKADTVCEVNVSRALANALDGADVHFEELEGPHRIAPESLPPFIQFLAHSPAP